MTGLNGCLIAQISIRVKVELGMKYKSRLEICFIAVFSRTSNSVSPSALTGSGWQHIAVQEGRSVILLNL